MVEVIIGRSFPKSATTTICHKIPTKWKNNNLPQDGRSHYGPISSAYRVEGFCTFLPGTLRNPCIGLLYPIANIDVSKGEHNPIGVSDREFGNMGSKRSSKASLPVSIEPIGVSRTF